MAHHLVELNAHRVPLLRLPVELINDIISFNFVGQLVKHWMKIGQVCSTLRAALLRRHDLWGDSVCLWPGHRDELLRRAGPSAPLVLTIFPSDNERNAEFVREHSTRARVLQSRDHPFTEKFLHLVTTQDFPLLEELELLSPSQIVALDPIASTRVMPRLKSLLLHGVYWTFPPSMLTELRIKSHKDDFVRFGYSPLQFVDILNQCKQLRTLELERCVPNLSNGLAHNEMMVLPCITKLSVFDLRGYALHLWNMLSVPPDAHVALHLECVSWTGEQSPSFSEDAALLKRHLINRQASRLVADEIHRGMTILSGGITIHITSISKSKPDPKDIAVSSQDDASTTLTLDYANCFELMREGDPELFTAYADAFRRLCAGLGLDRVTHLIWKAFSHMVRTKQLWMTILSALPALESLNVNRLHSSCGAALMSPLSDSDCDSDDSPQPALVVPRLKDLSFENAWIRREYDRNDGLTKEEILTLLEARAAQGCPLRLLRLQRNSWYPRNDEFDKLRDLLALQLPDSTSVVIA